MQAGLGQMGFEMSDLEEHAAERGLTSVSRARAHRQQSDRYRQLEAPWPAGAGVEVEDAFFAVEVGDVAVAGEDGGELGRGRLTVSAIDSRDYALVRGCLLAIGMTYVLVNFVTDMAYRWINPRMRG